MRRQRLYDSESESNISSSSVTSSNDEDHSEFSNNDSVSTSVFPEDSINCVRKFGDFEETYDWVECESRTFPGKLYYFNLRSLCSTWDRPVSRYVQLPRFDNSSKIYHDTSYDLQDPSIIMSGDENEDCKNEIPTSSVTMEACNKRIDKRLEIIARLYYDIYIEKLINDEKVECFDNHFIDFSDEAYYEGRNISEFIRSPSYMNEELLCINENEDKDEKDLLRKEEDWMNAESQFIATDFLETTFLVLEDAPETIERYKDQLMDENNASFIQDKKAYVSLSDASYEDEIDRKYSVPRLYRNFTERDLLRKVSKRRERGKNQNKREYLKRKRPRKIVCEMYGTKTINYDVIEPTLPPGVKTTNLSDSSSTTSSVWEEKNEKPTFLNNFDVCDTGLKVSKLSASESSSSTCSTYTCSCCSSSTSTTSN